MRSEHQHGTRSVPNRSAFRAFPEKPARKESIASLPPALVPVIASGQLFVVLHPFPDIARRSPDERTVERCATIPLERYFQPDVKDE